MKKLFVGKLSLSTTEPALRALFASYEPLRSVKIITDKFNGDSRGFGFIEIDINRNASDAIKTLNGAMLDGKTIIVSEARPPSDGPQNYGSRSDRNPRGSNRNNKRSSSNNRF